MDIQGSRPQCNKFVTKRNPCNPLVPVYKLASAQTRTATPPKFIRDQINIDDIDGSKPRRAQKWNNTRVTNDITDIDGARPAKIKLRKDFIGMQLNVKDINEFMKFESKRETNPLDPIYKGVNDKGDKITYGKIQGAKPKRLHPVKVNKVQSMFLNTGDIKGAQTFTLSNKFYKKETRKDFRNNTLTQDVPGAQSGTLKMGMKTMRCTNPIWPSYTYLDAGEINGRKIKKQPKKQETKKEQIKKDSQKQEKLLAIKPNKEQTVVTKQNDQNKQENNFIIQKPPLGQNQNGKQKLQPLQSQKNSSHKSQNGSQKGSRPGSKKSHHSGSSKRSRPGSKKSQLNKPQQQQKINLAININPKSAYEPKKYEKPKSNAQKLDAFISM